MRHDAHDPAARLSIAWDALQTGKPAGDVDGELQRAIARLEEIAHTPPPHPDLARQTWEQLTGGPLPLAPLVVDAAPGANGRYAVADPAVAAPRTRSRWQERALALYRAIAIGTIAGFAGGFVTGLWMRVAMRISGALTIDANRRLLTENDAAVGEITLAGTLSIAINGAAFGILGGLAYMLLRRWIPGHGWQRPLIYGGFLLAVLGFVIMDQNNPDYRLFGPPWLNVSMCGVAYILFGVLAGFLADWLERRVPSLTRAGRSRRRAVLSGVALAPFVLLGTLAMVGGVGGTGGVTVPVLLVCGLAYLLYKRVRRVRMLRPVAALARRPALVGYAAFSIPSLIGLVLTLRAITAIVGG